MKEAFVAGRVLVGGYFLLNAFHHFTSTASLALYAHSRGVPYPVLAVLVAGVLLLIAGLSLLLGLAPKIGIAATVLFLVPVTFMMHAFWNDTGMLRAFQLINFTKNLALMGAVLALAGVPEPWPVSLDAWLAPRRRRHVFGH